MEKLQGRRKKAYYDFLNSFIVEILNYVIDLSVTITYRKDQFCMLSCACFHAYMRICI